MTSENAGHYAAKHPPGTEADPRIAEMVDEKTVDGRITCAEAHAVATRLGVEPEQVGLAIDLAEKRISLCQLGLFGHGARRRIVAAAAVVDPELEQVIRAGLENGKLSCLRAWRIADTGGFPRIEVASACEALGIRISPCQLGAF